MGWFSSRRTAANTNGSALTPKVAAIVSRNFTVSIGYAIRHIINAKYEVRDDGGVFYRVDLDRKTCSCREFEMIAIPCTHAVAGAVNGKHDVESMVAREYTTAYWGLAYAESINPVNPSTATNEQPEMKLLPPNTRRPAGRPRKARIPSAGEIRVYHFF